MEIEHSLRVVLGVALAVLPLSQAAAEQEGDEERSPPESAEEQGVPSPDEALEVFVLMRLARSAALGGSEIDINAKGRMVALRGTVAEARDEARAVQIAQRTQGVKGVVSFLEVDPKQRPTRTVKLGDRELARLVARHLAGAVVEGKPLKDEELPYLWTIRGKDWSFEVYADEGDVWLEGTVGSFPEIGQVIREVRDMPGVRSVDSGLRVRLESAIGMLDDQATGTD